MKNKEQDILRYLIKVYSDFYAHKNLFNIEFKYSPKDLELLNGNSQFSSDINKQIEKKESISEDILALKTPDDVKEYISKYYTDTMHTKDELMNKLNLKEFDYLYKVIYSTPLKSNMRKVDALNSIEKYFYGISRAISIKP